MEKKRVETINKLKQIEIMNDYLIKKENIDIRNIVEWSKISDNFTQGDINRVRRQHLEKLDRYRKRKDWEAWVEEDEIDIEGERILSEIKNYKEEYFFQIMI